MLQMEVTLVPALVRSDLLNLSSLSERQALALLIQELGGFSPLHVTLRQYKSLLILICAITHPVSEKSFHSHYLCERMIINDNNNSFCLPVVAL